MGSHIGRPGAAYLPLQNQPPQTQYIPLQDYNQPALVNQPRLQEPMAYRPQQSRDWGTPRQHATQSLVCAPAAAAVGGFIGPCVQQTSLSGYSAGISALGSCGFAPVAIGATAGLTACHGCCDDDVELNELCATAPRHALNSCILTPIISVPSGLLGNLAGQFIAGLGFSTTAAAGGAAAVGCGVATIGSAAAYALVRCRCD